jgi:cytidine deaminase
LPASDECRLSVVVADVHAGREDEFLSLAERLHDVLARKQYARAETIRDEAVPSRFYVVRLWTSADAARRSHADPQMNELHAELHRLALVAHAINGARESSMRRASIDRRGGLEPDRRVGFDRRLRDVGRPEGDRRAGHERRMGPRRERESPFDLVGAARRAREHAAAAFSHFKVGAALETSEGTVVTGCNVENATYGLTVCAERVAMFTALAKGHRGFTRIAIVADTVSPTPPCGACRQILWEFGGDLEIRLANLTEDTGTYRLKDLLPLPFDARLLRQT